MFTQLIYVVFRNTVTQDRWKGSGRKERRGTRVGFRQEFHTIRERYFLSKGELG